MEKEQMIKIEYCICEKRVIARLLEEENEGIKIICLEGRKRSLPYYIHETGTVLGYFGVMGIIENTITLFFQEIQPRKFGLMVLYQRPDKSYGKFCIGHTKSKAKAEEWDKKFKTFLKKGDKHDFRK